MPFDAGKRKVAFCQRLGDSWRQLALYFDIPAAERDRFGPGDAGREILDWLERHGRLDALPEALAFIGREDLALILEPPPAPAATTQPLPGSPFPGLRPFAEADAPVFFGRTRHVQELIDRLNHPQHRFLAVVGASGAGKSSVVAAGLLPRLKQNAVPGSQDWIVLKCTPGGSSNDPFPVLAARLEPLLERHGWRAHDIDRKLRSSGALPELAQQALDHSPHAELLLFIDQFEELFTLCDETHRLPFINMLAKAVTSPRLRIVVTMRADFSSHCLHYGKLADLLKSGFYPLPPPSIAELYDMITAPAACAIHTITPCLSRFQHVQHLTQCVIDAGHTCRGQSQEGAMSKATVVNRA